MTDAYVYIPVIATYTVPATEAKAFLIWRSLMSIGDKAFRDCSD